MKKTLKITGIVVAALLLVLALSPYLFRNRIMEEVKKMANRNLKTELNFSGMSVSFFSHFPNLAVTLSDFSLKSSPPFTDTLVSAKEIALGINLRSLFDTTIVINRIYIDQARVNILFNEKGNPNYDIYRSSDTTGTSSDTAGTSAQLRIEKIYFRDCRIRYADLSLGVDVLADGFDYNGKSSLEGVIFDLSSDVKIRALSVEYGKTKYLDAKPVKAKLSTKVNTKDLTIIFEKNNLQIKDIPLQFHGKFNFEKNGYQVNLNFLSVLEKEFFSARFRITQGDSLYLFARANASITVAKWAKALDVKDVDIRGLYELNLEADGPYITGPVQHGPRKQVDTVILSIPKFTLMTKFTNGYLKYTRLPHALEGISFLLNASCPDNNYRHTRVAIEDLHATFLKNELKGYFRLNGLENFPVEAQLSGGCNLAELKQVVPLDSISLSGMLSLDITAKGNYAPGKKMFPATKALISLREGSLLTSYYPHPLEKMEMTAEVTNTSGTMKDLVVGIHPFSFEFEGKPFTLTAALENFDDMRYDVRSTGIIDLGKVYRVFSQKGLDLDGTIETDMSLKGKQSDATAGRIALLDNRGTLKLQNIAVRSDLYPKPFIIRTGNFRFSQDKVWFDDFLATYGASDFRLRGAMQNTINYVLSQGGTLKGEFELKSTLVDADEFMAFAPSDSASMPAESGVVIIPRDLDVGLKAQIAKTTLKGLEIKDLAGGIDLKEGILVLHDASFETAGCKVKMDVTYGNVTAMKGFFDFHVKAEDFDIKRAYTEVAMVREMMPSAGKAEGIVSLDYTLKGMLDSTLFPVMKSLDGSGVLSVKKVKVYGLKLFNDISKGTEKEGIKNPDISKVDIKSTIRNNTVTVEQFKFKVKGIRVRISGSTTFDQKMDLKVRLGLGPLGIIGIPMKVTGTFDNPKIKYGKGKDTEELKESDYSDQLPPEMLQRIRNAKEDAGDDDDSEGRK